MARHCSKRSWLRNTVLNKTRQLGYHPERSVKVSQSFELPMPLTLAVMLLTRDRLRCASVCRDNPSPLFFRHDAIGLFFVLHLVDLFLLLVHTVCFSLAQLPVHNPLINPRLLIRSAADRSVFRTRQRPSRLSTRIEDQPGGTLTRQGQPAISHAAERL